MIQKSFVRSFVDDDPLANGLDSESHEAICRVRSTITCRVGVTIMSPTASLPGGSFPSTKSPGSPQMSIHFINFREPSPSGQLLLLRWEMCLLARTCPCGWTSWAITWPSFRHLRGQSETPNGTVTIVWRTQYTIGHVPKSTMVQSSKPQSHFPTD